MMMTGAMLIERVCQKLKDDGNIATDNNILYKIRDLSWKELNELSLLGDVAKWRNDRQENKGDKV